MSRKPLTTLAVPLISIFMCCCAYVTADDLTLVTHASKAHNSDTRRDYEKRLLQLALKKTRDKYGDYKVVPAHSGMTFSRELEQMKANRYTNHVRSFPFDPDLADEHLLTYIEFPIYLGGLGYRVCFVSDVVQDKVARVEKLEDLYQFRFGQGVGWQDVEILRHAGLTVQEISDYESLFKMTAANRIDLFCRGVNEYLSELSLHKNLRGLTLDESFALYYPFPRYFYSNSKNGALLKRIKEGLLKAYADRSLQTLWGEYHLQGFRRAKLQERKVFRLQNPILIGEKQDYLKYFYQPESVTNMIDGKKTLPRNL